jgi:hypothetical protein
MVTRFVFFAQQWFSSIHASAPSGFSPRHVATAVRLVAGVLVLVALAPLTAAAQDVSGQHPPEVPATLEPPAGQEPFLIARAVGTQNYICQATLTGPGWRLFGPQATLFHAVGGALRKQIATHFLSANPVEAAIARPTWQDSIDSSRIWGRAAADPVSVRADAIPWLLVQVVGAAPGTLGSSRLAQSTFIQRVNTVGGLADPITCDASRIGATVLVPYEADYVFYRSVGPE